MRRVGGVGGCPWVWWWFCSAHSWAAAPGTVVASEAAAAGTLPATGKARPKQRGQELLSGHLRVKAVPTCGQKGIGAGANIPRLTGKAFRAAVAQAPAVKPQYRVRWGMDVTRALQRSGCSGPVQGGPGAGPEERSGLSGPGLQRVRMGSTTVRPQLAQQGSADGSAIDCRPMSCWRLSPWEDSEPDAGRCGSGRGAEDFRRRASTRWPCTPVSSCSRIAVRILWFGKITAINPSYGQGLRRYGASPHSQRALRGRCCLLSQGLDGGPAALAGACGTGHQPDASG